MKTFVWCGLVLMGLAGVSLAGPEETAVLAAMKLSEEPSYAWTTAVEDGVRPYSVTGKAVKGSYTWIKMPMIDAIADRLGRDGDTEIEAFFNGPDRCVIRAGDQWKAPEELPRAELKEDMMFLVTAPMAFPMVTADMPADPNGRFMTSPPVILVPATRDHMRPFSNAQLALSAPHEELAILVSSWQQLNVTEKTVTGAISDVGARLLLAPADRENVTPLLAVGLFKLWVKDERVVRYQLRLEGIFQVGKKQVLVCQTSETTVQNIGKVALSVPAEVRAKLGN